MDGGIERVVAASQNMDFIHLVVLNGAMYYAEQVMQFKAVEQYTSLTYGVIDTARRLCIVVFTGYVMFKMKIYTYYITMSRFIQILILLLFFCIAMY